jgi:hypothetical protein
MFPNDSATIQSMCCMKVVGISDHTFLLYKTAHKKRQFTPAKGSGLDVISCLLSVLIKWHHLMQIACIGCGLYSAADHHHRSEPCRVAFHARAGRRCPFHEAWRDAQPLEKHGLVRETWVGEPFRLKWNNCYLSRLPHVVGKTCTFRGHRDGSDFCTGNGISDGSWGRVFGPALHVLSAPIPEENELFSN